MGEGRVERGGEGVGSGDWKEVREIIIVRYRRGFEDWVLYLSRRWSIGAQKPVKQEGHQALELFGAGRRVVMGRRAVRKGR